jgi:thiol-disulfide isomerase/thioredoxin
LLMNIPKSLLLSCLIFFMACTSHQKDPVEIINIEGLQGLIKENNHQLHIINFWATWCKPCVKELPLFTDLAKSNPEISISLVSLDFVQDLETKVYPFLNNKNIDIRVLLIDELDYNLWIDMVDPSWSGAIPATLIIEPDTGRRIFLEKEFENDELVDLIESFTNNNL